MTFTAAHKIGLIFGALFLMIVGIVFAGAVYYKQSAIPTSQSSEIVSETVTPSAEELEPALLQLIPSTDEQTTYRIVVSNLVQPINGISFELQSNPGGATITSNSIEIEEDLENNGWSTAVNSATETDSSQRLSFSMLLNSPGTEVTSNSIEIGTISFDQTPSSIDLSLNPDESVVTYTEDRIATLNLVLETDTMSN
jgi:hypothetical protein